MEPYTGDERVFVEAIERDIIDRNLGVTFEDIAALEDAKRLLNEAVMLPLILPDFFTGSCLLASSFVFAISADSAESRTIGTAIYIYIYIGCRHS